MPKLKIKKGDKVVVLAGKDKGKQGEVVKVFPTENRAIVKGVAVIWRHQKQTPTQEGGIVAKEAADPYFESCDRRPQGREADPRRLQIFEGWAQGSLRQALGRSDRWLRPRMCRG